MSIPCGKDKAGLPVGMQLIGRKFDEATILRAAYFFEHNGGFTMEECERGVSL